VETEYETGLKQDFIVRSQPRSKYRGVIDVRKVKKHGVTVAKVKKDMQAAIDYAYTKTDKSDREKMMQESIPRRSEVPTAGEFVESVAHKLLKEMVKAERG